MLSGRRGFLSGGLIGFVLTLLGSPPVKADENRLRRFPVYRVRVNGNELVQEEGFLNYNADGRLVSIDDYK